MPTRRKILALLGGGAILAAGGGGFIATRQAGAAVAPWTLAGSYGEIRRDALSWALLAPNPHNLQPWLAELVGEDAVALHLDTSRSLPQTDPFGRQLTIGMGCFLELMRMAAAQAGHAVDLDLYPEGEKGPVAFARFRAGHAMPDPLFAFAATRRSCKEPFSDRPVPPEAVAALAPHGTVVTDPASVQALRDLTWQASLIEMQTPRTWKESVDLLRIGWRAVNASPDGIDLVNPMFNIAGPLGLITREGQLAPDSLGARQTRDAHAAIMQATQAHVVQVSDGNSRADQIAAGAAWLRLNLAATGLGLSLHPVSQALQEYPEMAVPYGRIHALHAGPGQTVQMLGRLGYGPAVARTPRWRLENKLI